MERERKEEPKTLSGVIWSWIIVLFSLFTVVPALGPYSRVGTLVIVVFSVVSAWRSYKSFMKIRAGGGMERPRPSPPPVETHDHISLHRPGHEAPPGAAGEPESRRPCGQTGVWAVTGTNFEGAVSL